MVDTVVAHNCFCDMACQKLFRNVMREGRICEYSGTALLSALKEDRLVPQRHSLEVRLKRGGEKSLSHREPSCKCYSL